MALKFSLVWRIASTVCVLAGVLWVTGVRAQTLVITNGVRIFSALTNVSATLSNRCELRVTAASNPLSGCAIQLNSEDAFLVLQAVKPSAARSYLPQVRVNGGAAVSGVNCRITQYGAGSIIVPHSPGIRPLQLFEGPQFAGGSLPCAPYVYYRGRALGGLDRRVGSFTLKRGYTATLAQNSDGTGTSRNYVAQDGDLNVSLLPAELSGAVRFVFVTPWRWSAKKGIAGDIDAPLKVQWKYNWSISQNSTADLEYVPIRQSRYWPDLAGQNWQTRSASHLLGYNEPDRPDQANLTVADAVSSWGDLLATGLRVGAPAVSDGGRDSWLYPFIRQADSSGLRVDFVPVHYYWCHDPTDPAGAANQFYGFLKATYDAVKRPLWITEWNNGANWTGCADPTPAQQQACVSAMVEMLEATPFVERYALYNWVEDVRRVEWDDGSLTSAGTAYRDQASSLAYRQTFPDNETRGVAYLPFDGNALDSSGFGNNGVTAGSPTFVSGRKGAALSFDGTNTAVTLPPNVAQGTAFTFAAWVRWKGGGNWQRIFDFGNSTAEYLFLTPSSGGGTLRFAINSGGGEQAVEAVALPANQWRHVAVTLGGGTARIYVNGVLAASKTAVNITPSAIHPRVNFLGRSQFVADPAFNGQMDDVVISDTAMSAAQIATLQNDAAPQFSNLPLVVPTATQGQIYAASIAGTATDPDGDSVTYSKVTGPAWLSISPAGNISGTPTGDSLGTNYLTLRASDPAGLGTFTVLPLIVDSSIAGLPSLVARYPLNGTADDSSGNAFHATAVGSPSYASGKFGSSINLDGTNGFLKLPATLLSGVSNLTFSVWVNWRGGAPWQRIFDLGNDTSQYLYLTPAAGNGRLRFSIKNSGSEQLVESAVCPTNQWCHLAVTLKGRAVRLYVNGVQAAANLGLTISPTDFEPQVNYLGKSQFSDPLFNGRMDEVMLFNYALTGAEVLALTANRLPSPTGPQLTATPLGAGLLLGWPADYVGWRLESAAAGFGSWSPVAGSDSTNQMSLGMDSSSLFFRLMHP